MGAACVVTRVRWPGGRDLAILAGMGAIGYAGQAASFFTALTLAPAGLVALLLYLHPALVAVLAARRLHERLPAIGLWAIAVALAGTALTVGAGAPDQRRVDPAGRRGAGRAGRRHLLRVHRHGQRRRARVDALAMSTVIIASAAVTYCIAVALRGPAWPASAAGWSAVLAIAIVSTAGAITMFFAGLARIGPTRAATLSTIEPVVTIVLAAIVLGERAGGWQLAGGALILAAVVRPRARARSCVAPTKPVSVGPAGHG